MKINSNLKLKLHIITKSRYLILLATIILLSQSNIGISQSRIDSLYADYNRDINDIQTLESLVDYYSTKNIDSLNRYAILLISITDNESRNEVLLKRVSAYILFNEFKIADSLLQTIVLNEVMNLESKSTYLMILGRILKKKRNFNQALENYYTALKIIKQQNINHLLPEVYSEIASILKENNDLENCTKYYRYALAETKKLNNIELEINIYYALCRIYNGGITVNLDSSIYYGELGVEISKNANYEFGYATMIKVVAAPLIRNGQYRKGLEMSKEALTYSDKFNFSPRSQYYLINNQGFAYEKLGLYDSALIKMKEGVKIYPSGIDHFRLEYLIYKSKNNNIKALRAFEIYKVKYDSIMKHRNESKLSLLQARLEADINEAEVISLTQTGKLQAYQLTQQKLFLGGLFAVIIMIITASILIHRQKQLKQKQALTNLELEETQKRLDIEKQYRSSELKALRSQMNPHFLFNALNSIQEFIVSNEKKLAGKYLGKFADLMRMYLLHSQTKTISLREETDALAIYLELEKLRFEESISFSMEIDTNIDSDNTLIPSLIVQPYVENAIKHGLLHKESDRKLSISFHIIIKNQILECVIIDNGVGRVKSEEINKIRNPNHKSFAINATKTRLELLNYNSDNPIGEEIIDLYDDKIPLGTKVVLSIPIIEFNA